jgi:hypothetical protein
MNKDEIIRHSHEYWEEVRRVREARGQGTSFLDPINDSYLLEDLVAEARERGRTEGPSYLTPSETAIAEKIRDATDALKFPERHQWIERILRIFGAQPTSNSGSPNHSDQLRGQGTVN